MKSTDDIDYVDICYDNKTVEMKCTTTINKQWGIDRYSGSIPLVDDNVEKKLSDEILTHYTSNS